MRSNTVNQVADSALRRRVRWIVVLLFVAGFLGWRMSYEAAEPPLDSVQRNEGWADEQSCADCHEQADQFPLTGHARTLLPATDEDSRAVLRRLLETPEAVAEGMQVDADGEVILAVHRSGGRTHELELDWCFGSGRHARTWVGTLSDSWGASDLAEFRWTWYDEIDGFDVTPGQPANGIGGYFHGLGVLHDHPKTRLCFACHSSHLPLSDGRLDAAALKPGVTCQRCHGPRAEHVESEGEVIDGFWREADQTESINRCAQCHRRAEEQEPEDITADNVEIVRFQPVGLVQSACFKGSAELTCVTCHDPHRPLEAQNSLGIWQCVQCHDSTHEDHTTCRAGHIDDCLTCHMPRVRSDAPVYFTDHWIRIREPSE